MEEVLNNRQRRIVDFFPAVNVNEIPEKTWQTYDSEGLSFRNINTPQEYFILRETLGKVIYIEAENSTMAQDVHF